MRACFVRIHNPENLIGRGLNRFKAKLTKNMDQTQVRPAQGKAILASRFKVLEVDDEQEETEGPSSGIDIEPGEKTQAQKPKQIVMSSRP